MANRRFIDFPIASTVGDNDIVLIWQDGANKQTTKATILSGLPENLEDLNDVVISGLTNGQILRYDSVTGKWENTDQGNLDLNDLNDVSIVSPSNGQVLVYNSSTSKWENSSGGYVPYTGAVTTVNLGAQTIQAGQFVKAGGTSSQFLKADGSIDSTAYGTGSVTSVALTMPSAFNVANSPITTAGTLAVTGSGTVGQYIRGDGSLADFPQASGGGSSVSYYLNGSVNQGTIGGVAYRELSKVPILGAGTDFTINADGYIASFITDAGDPNLLEIPGGNWNFETYFSASSSGGTPTFYVELYKYDGTTFTLIASSSSAPELIAFGTSLNPYFSSLAVPTTTLALTDRLAIRYYVTHSGRTITLHTENNHLCQVITTFTTGLTSLNGLTAQVQNLAVGTSGTDFNIVSATATHTFNLPTASATNRGALSSADWTTFNNKQNAGNYVTTDTSQLISGLKTFNVNTLMMQSSGNANAVYLSNSSGSSTYQSGFNFFGFNTDNHIYFAKSSITGGNTGILAWTNTATRTYTLKDASGTLAFTSDIPANPVGGTGTTNYLPKFTGSTTIGNSAITDDGTSVNVISRTLTITRGNYSAFGFEINQQSTFAFGSTNGKRVAIITDATAADNGLQFGYDTVDKTGIIAGSATSAGTGIDFYTYNGSAWGNRARVTASGNLLVGTTTDNGARLQVSGGITALNSLVVTSSSNAALIASTNSTTGFSYLDFINSGASGRNYQIGVAGNGASSGYANNLYFDLVGVANIMTLTSGRNVLIGTQTDNGARLQVSGAIFTSLSNGVIIVRDNGTSQVEVNVRHTSTRDGVVSFTQDGVADRWAIGTKPSDGTLYFSANFNLSTPRLSITSSGNVGIGTSSPSALLSVSKSSDSGSGSVFPRLQVENTLATQGNGSSTFNFADIRIATGNGSAEMYLASSFASGTWEPQGLISVATNHPMIFRTNNTERMRITSGGKVLIGTTTDSGENLQVKNGMSLFQLPSGTNGAILKLGRSAGAYYWHLGINGTTSNFEFYDNALNVLSNINVTTGAYTAVSDINKKKDFEDSTIGLNAILGLKPTLYRMKSESNTQKHLGFIAQEVKEYIPQAYMQNGDFIGLNEMPIIAALTKAIQELKAEIDTLKN